MSALPLSNSLPDFDGSVFLARQPILDREEKLYAYELLFRSNGDNQFQPGTIEASQATSTLINTMLHHIPIQDVLSQKPAFLNLTQDLLENEVYALFSPDQVVLELLETVVVDNGVTEAYRKARDAGYVMALDDVRAMPFPEELLELTDIIKIDLMEMDRERLTDLATKLRSRCSAKLLAEKVETREDFELCLELGFDLFQGYFFCRPEMFKSRAPSGIKTVYLELIRQINSVEYEPEKIEEIIKRDPTLTTKMLRYINSAAMGVRNEITSLRMAMNLLGEKAVRKWAYIATLGSLNIGKPSELLRTCLVRAHFAERLAIAEGRPEDSFNMFLVGMASLLDAILDEPVPTLAERLGLSDEVVDTLMGSPNAPTFNCTVLELIHACEQGDWSRVITLSGELKLYQSEIAVAYYEGMNFANQVITVD